MNERASKRKIGVIFPDEGAYPYELLDGAFVTQWLAERGFGDFEYHIERVPGGKPLSLEDCADLAKEDELLPAARRLRSVKPDAVLWACVSASFHKGLGYAERQAGALSRESGAPATSASLAMAQAVKSLGTNKVDVMMNYVPPVADQFIKFLSEEKLDVVKVRHMQCSLKQRAFDLDYRSELSAFTESLPDRDHPVLIPSTSLSSLRIVSDLERIAKRPVITANLASIWELLTLMNIEPYTDEASALFRRH
jgi:maleate isomerase